MILYGASGHGRVIWEILEANGTTPSAIWDDADKEPIWDVRISKPGDLHNEKLIISIGENSIRKLISERYDSSVFGIAIHPSAIISNSAGINVGTVVMPNAVINADALVGKHCIVNTGAIIEHDCRIADFVHLSPNATLCGNVTVGEGTHIGAGAVIIPGVTIGKWSKVGAGAVIIRDVPDKTTVVGNPMRIIK